MTTRLTPSRQKYILIEKLAERVKQGDIKANKQLLDEFAWLIRKISGQIRIRYGAIFPLAEIERQGRVNLIYLTITKYEPGGKAHYPHFIKTALHASLVLLYRPLYKSAIKFESLDQAINKVNDPFEDIYKHECEEAYHKVMEYAKTKCTKREREIIEYILTGYSRYKFAKDHHISAICAKAMYNRLMKKLRGVIK